MLQRFLMGLYWEEGNAQLPQAFCQARYVVLIVCLVGLASPGDTGIELRMGDAVGYRVKPCRGEIGFQRIADRDGHDLCFTCQSLQWRQVICFEEIMEIADEKDSCAGAGNPLELLE